MSGFACISPKKSHEVFLWKRILLKNARLLITSAFWDIFTYAFFVYILSRYLCYTLCKSIMIKTKGATPTKAERTVKNIIAGRLYSRCLVDLHENSQKSQEWLGLNKWELLCFLTYFPKTRTKQICHVNLIHVTVNSVTTLGSCIKWHVNYDIKRECEFYWRLGCIQKAHHRLMCYCYWDGSTVLPTL